MSRFTRIMTAAAVLLSTVPTGRVAAEANEQPGAPATAASVAAGLSHTCAVLDGGDVACWGSNVRGALGLGDTQARGDAAGEMGGSLPFVDLGAGRNAVAVTAGEAHTCVLLDTGQVACWGANGQGQLGLGHTRDIGDEPGEMGSALQTVDLGTGRTATAVAAGFSHTCAVLDTGQLTCWGANTLGQLGLGNTTTRGDGDGEMGASLAIVQLGTGRTVTAVTAGLDHTCALLDNQQVKCWGGNFSGQLGYGDLTDRGDNALEMGGLLPAVALGTGRHAVAISAGSTHTCALLDNQQAKCWGGNSEGQLGIGSTLDRGDGAGEMGDNLAAVDLGGTRRAAAITAGGFHTCVLTTRGQVACWGSNSDGELGIGTSENRGDAAGELGAALVLAAPSGLSTAIGVTAGADHTCTVLDSGSLACWGGNFDGQLGLGDTATRGDGPNEMGASLFPVGLPGDLLVLSATISLSTSDRTLVGFADETTVTVTNTSRRTLSGATIVASDLPGCAGAVPELAPGEVHTVTCDSIATADQVPTRRLRAALVMPGGIVVSEPVFTTVSPVVRRLDALLRRGGGSFVGNGVFSSDGTGQTRRADVTASGRVTFTARVESESNVKTRALVRGTGSTRRFLVTYRRDGIDVTSAVVAGTFTSRTLAPGATEDLTVTVTPRSASRVGDRYTGTVTFTVDGTASATDTVRFVVTRS